LGQGLLSSNLEQAKGDNNVLKLFWRKKLELLSLAQGLNDPQRVARTVLASAYLPV
jgi:hypothetical protein